MRARRRVGWLYRTVAFAVFLAVAHLGGVWAERGLIAIALAGTLGAIPRWSGRRLAGPAALAPFGAAAASLAIRFLTDDFAYHSVWLQSAPQLDPWLKLANIWSGDEGTVLLLGLIGLAMAARLDRHGGWSGPGAYALAAVFIVGALIWDPFRETPPAALAAHPYRGMNAHLTSVWMAVHPPLVFFSYMLLAAPCGAMLEALALRRGRWREIAAIYGRGGWLVLSAGIAFGMWWAYEDFTYGTLWHWDPVQSAIFVSWAFLTAMLHAQRRYRPNGHFGIAHPVLGLLAAAGAILAMAVTRSPTLASSHRYVGETSLPLIVGLAAAILVALLVCLAVRLSRGRSRRQVPAERRSLIWAAIAIFSACGGVAAIQIGVAFWSAWQGLPRPDDLKPFFETLRNFAPAEEISRLRAAFAQWDIDNFAANRWLVPLGCLIGLVGGHYFLPFSRRIRWAATLAVVAAGLLCAFWIRPFERLFQGAGLTSGKTVAIFPWLDFLSASIAYLLIAILLWVAAAGIRGSARVTWRYGVPVGAIHAGAMIALVGVLGATVFDSFSQKLVSVRSEQPQPISFPGGYRLRISTFDTSRTRDGARVAGAAEAFKSVARVEWSLTRNGRIVNRQKGQTVYRDDRPPYSNEVGSVRLMCAIIDYRYARYMSREKRMIHPLISRGLWRDVQIWVPAVSRREDGARDGRAAPGTVPVILKVFPLMSLVWIGLSFALLGFLALFVAEMERPDRLRTGRRRAP